MLFLGNVLAQCSDGQININTASATELDKITYVGNATAIKIIDTRPFSSVDDLIRVKGIGNKTLEKIKAQGLACVKSSDNKEESTKQEETIQEIASSQMEDISISPPVVQENLTPEIKELQVIKLNSKDIKNNNSIQENKEGISIKNYASFGLMALCIFVLILLFLKNKKNELQ